MVATTAQFWLAPFGSLSILIWTTIDFILSLSLMLRPTVNRPNCLGIKHPSGVHDKIFITVIQLGVCWCERTGVSFTIAAGFRQRSHSRVWVPWDLRPYFIFSESRLPFSCLLGLAGLRWEYSTPPTHAIDFILIWTASYIVYQYQSTCFLNANVHGNVSWSHNNVLVSNNLSPWKHLSISYHRKRVP
jgi:hypothetical protein